MAVNDNQSKYKSILVIDDHKMVANGIQLVIGHMFEDFYLAHDGATGMSKALRHFPQLIVLDYFLPDTKGEILVRELKYKVPSARILAYTFSYSPDTIIKLLQAGINGYVIKKEDDEEFVNAINYLANGKDYFCKEARIHIINRFSESEDQSMKHLIANTKFSGKELELIKLLCKQMSTKEISAHLNLTNRTIEQYRSNILRKISAKNLAGIIKFALQNGIVDLDGL